MTKTSLSPTGASQHASGFSLIELMIAVAVIAILAAIAIPNAMAARARANEVAAISTIRSIWTAQAQFQRTGKVDLDGDGLGESGVLGELSGARGLRTSADGSAVGPTLYPTVLGGGFGLISASGAATRSGYHYQMYLPSAAGLGVAERPRGPFSDVVDTDLAEEYFCVYAWPANTGSTGERTFFVNQKGEITQTADAAYTGTDMYIMGAPGMAFESGGSLDSVTGAAAVGTVGRDGNLWRVVR